MRARSARLSLVFTVFGSSNSSAPFALFSARQYSARLFGAPPPPYTDLYGNLRVKFRDAVIQSVACRATSYSTEGPCSRR